MKLSFPLNSCKVVKEEKSESPGNQRRKISDLQEYQKSSQRIQILSSSPIKTRKSRRQISRASRKSTLNQLDTKSFVKIPLRGSIRIDSLSKLTPSPRIKALRKQSGQETPKLGSKGSQKKSNINNKVESINNSNHNLDQPEFWQNFKSVNTVNSIQTLQDIHQAESAKNQNRSSSAYPLSQMNPSRKMISRQNSLLIENRLSQNQGRESQNTLTQIKQSQNIKEENESMIPHVEQYEKRARFSSSQLSVQKISKNNSTQHELNSCLLPKSRKSPAYSMQKFTNSNIISSSSIGQKLAQKILSKPKSRFSKVAISVKVRRAKQPDFSQQSDNEAEDETGVKKLYFEQQIESDSSSSIDEHEALIKNSRDNKMPKMNVLISPSKIKNRNLNQQVIEEISHR